MKSLLRSAASTTANTNSANAAKTNDDNATIDNTKKSGLSTGAILGIVLACIVVLGIAFYILSFYLNWKAKNSHSMVTVPIAQHSRMLSQQPSTMLPESR
uniref:Uncharacterized protein n=1 Tax=viral metagenome TaxID=1070528 RepID=A0A6C0CR26_9ZZZZ